jgi:hypothetical protein
MPTQQNQRFETLQLQRKGWSVAVWLLKRGEGETGPQAPAEGRRRRGGSYRRVARRQGPPTGKGTYRCEPRR